MTLPLGGFFEASSNLYILKFIVTLCFILYIITALRVFVCLRFRAPALYIAKMMPNIISAPGANFWKRPPAGRMIFIRHLYTVYDFYMALVI